MRSLSGKGEFFFDRYLVGIGWVGLVVEDSFYFGFRAFCGYSFSSDRCSFLIRFRFTIYIRLSFCTWEKVR